MTELEQARTHLRRCQTDLDMARQRNRGGFFDAMNVDHAATAVLAALSWVWDAQERAAQDYVFADVIAARIVAQQTGRLMVGDTVTWP